jgi:hypothetical protein
MITFNGLNSMKRETVLDYLLKLAILTSSFDIFLTINLQGFTLRFSQLVFSLAILLWLFIKVQNKMFLVRLPFGSTLLILFFVINTIFITATDLLLRSIGYDLYLAYMILFIFVLSDFYTKDELVTKLIKFYYFSFGCIALFGLIQFVFGFFEFADLLLQQRLSFLGLPRINGFSFEPSFYATYMTAGLFLGFHVKWSSSYIIGYTYDTIILALIFSSYLLTISRSAYLTLLLVVLFYLIFLITRTIKKMSLTKNQTFLMFYTISSIVFLLVTVFFLTGGFEVLFFRIESLLNKPIEIIVAGTESSVYRIRRAAYTLQAAIDSPLKGVSLGGVPVEIGNLRGALVTNQFAATRSQGIVVLLEIWVGTGLIGLLTFIAYNLYLIISCINLNKEYRKFSRREYSILVGLVIGLLAQLFILQANQNILRLYYWYHLGILSCYALTLKQLRSSKK